MLCFNAKVNKVPFFPRECQSSENYDRFFFVVSGNECYFSEVFKICQKSSKTPLRLCQDRQPIDLVDTEETAAIA